MIHLRMSCACIALLLALKGSAERRACTSPQQPEYLQKQLVGDACVVHLAGQSQLVGGAQVLVRGSQGLVYGKPGCKCQAVQL